MKNDNSGPTNAERKVLQDHLHDLSSWLYSGVILPLEAMDEWRKQGNYDKVSEILPDLIVRARNLLDELKDMQANPFQTRESKKDELSAALQELVNIWLARVGLQDQRLIAVECPSHMELPAEAQEALIAITDEAIANAIKYSGFLTHPEIRIYIKVRFLGSSLELAIEDDGAGAAIIRERYGFGKIQRILSELQRLELGADMEIITSPGKGFTLLVKIKTANTP